MRKKWKTSFLFMKTFSFSIKIWLRPIETGLRCSCFSSHADLWESTEIGPAYSLKLLPQLLDNRRTNLPFGSIDTIIKVQINGFKKWFFNDCSYLGMNSSPKHTLDGFSSSLIMYLYLCSKFRLLIFKTLKTLSTLTIQDSEC